MGKLIVIEGLDSSGKETQSRLLTQNLKKIGKNVMRCEFPNYKSSSSELVKMYLSGAFGKSAGDVNAYAASSFYAVDRYATFKTELEDFYKLGGIIIADRYTTSNIIHQAGKITDEAELDKYLDWLCDFEYNLLGLPCPDAVVFLDMPPQTGIKLMENRKNKAGGDQKDIHERDRKYLFDTYDCAKKMVSRFEWQTVMCTDGEAVRTIENIQEDVIKYALKALEA